MGADRARLVADRVEASATHALGVEARVAPSLEVGSIYRVRRGLRKEVFIVIDRDRSHVKGIWRDGEVEVRLVQRLGQAVVPASPAIRSHAGRLKRLLSGAVSDEFVTKPAAAELGKRVDAMLRRAGGNHAVGLLLDRKALSLTEEECGRLPLAAWRVNYELLQDHAAGSRQRRARAAALVADFAAPLGVRARVALAEGVELGSLGADIAALFAPSSATRPDMASAANTLGAALVAAGLKRAERLSLASRTPGWFAATSSRAAAYSVLSGGSPQAARQIDIGGLSLSAVDDLIDAGASVTASTIDGAVDVDDMQGVSWSTYIAARTRPDELTTDAVIALKFAGEAYRRYLRGDDDVAAAMPGLKLKDAMAARSIAKGDQPVEEAHDPLLRELADALKAGAAGSASAELLADSSTWGVLISKGVRASRDGGSQSEQYEDLFALHQAREALFSWNWARAQEIARDRLRGARREAVRDELLNLIACGLWLEDRPEPALAALDSALEGEYTEALLTNAAVVATELEHWSAIQRFVKIAREAPSSQQRAMAAERALLLWVNDDARIWADDDETIPEDILAALRPLIREQIPTERYLRIVRTLAIHDSNWLAAQPPGAFGRNAGSAAARIFQGRARGVEEFVAELSKELRTGLAEKWVEEERDSVVEAAVNILAEQNDEMGGAFFGLTLLKGGLPLEPRQRVPLTCFTVMSITQNIDTDQGEPKDELIDWVIGAKHALASLDEEDRRLLAPLVTLAGEELARTFARARAPQIDQAREAIVRVTAQLAGMPSWQINHEKVQEVMAPLSKFCSETWQVLHKVRPLISDCDLLRAIDELMGMASNLGGMAVKLR